MKISLKIIAIGICIYMIVSGGMAGDIGMAALAVVLAIMALDNAPQKTENQ
jgi:hypothetical protein